MTFPMFHWSPEEGSLLIRVSEKPSNLLLENVETESLDELLLRLSYGVGGKGWWPSILSVGRRGGNAGVMKPPLSSETLKYELVRGGSVGGSSESAWGLTFSFPKMIVGDAGGFAGGSAFRGLGPRTFFVMDTSLSEGLPGNGGAPPTGFLLIEPVIDC